MTSPAEEMAVALLDGLEPYESVAIVGTRRATSYGREVARELGREGHPSRR